MNGRVCPASWIEAMEVSAWGEGVGQSGCCASACYICSLRREPGDLLLTSLNVYMNLKNEEPMHSLRVDIVGV